jgi:hypothetical protein
MGKVLHASDSGYFLGCIEQSTNSRDGVWSLEKAMQTYWRVRTWTFSASGIATSDDDPSDFFPISSTITGITSQDSQTDVPQTLEEGLVCGNYFEFFGARRYYAFIEFGQAKTNGGLYNSGLVGEVLDYRTNPLEFVFSAEGSSAFSISILGTNIPIIMNYINDDEENSYTITSGSATLTPTLWWSYGGTYSTSTGAPL